MSEENHSPVYLITGLLLGLVMGLVYSLAVAPLSYKDTDPSALRAEDRDAYRSMVALAYAADANLERALSRLALLGEADLRGELAAQAQRLMAEPGYQSEARALAQLSLALQTAGGGQIPPTPNPLATQNPATPVATLDLNAAVQTPTTPPTPIPSQTPTETPTPLPTFTLRPTFTPLPTLGAPFVLQSQAEDCAAPLPLIQVEVIDADGTPVPFIRVDVTWDGGTDYFLTGLYPEQSPGYGDYEMTPGTVYTLRVGESGQLVGDLTAPSCVDGNGTTYWGGLRLIFTQP
ncbi:MAG TPA: hypothetical protein PKG95_10845 [Anaerolineaceae bacterium]|nr:hypothetical protein [Anaerolineaceae bacterium]